MAVDLSEKAFEDAIEAALLSGVSGAAATTADEVRETSGIFGTPGVPDSYRSRISHDYHRTLCLISSDVLDFILATQPKEWARLKQHHGIDTNERFLKRLSREIERRGTLDVLRKGVKDSG